MRQALVLKVQPGLIFVQFGVTLSYCIDDRGREHLVGLKDCWDCLIRSRFRTRLMLMEDMSGMNSTDGVMIDTTSQFCGLETDCVNNSATPSPPPQWGLLTLSVIPVWIVAGNVLVLLALLLQPHLQNMSNRVIASLAVTDFLLALIVVPFSIYQSVRVRIRRVLITVISDVAEELTNHSLSRSPPPVGGAGYIDAVYTLHIRTVGLRPCVCVCVCVLTLSLFTR